MEPSKAFFRHRYRRRLAVALALTLSSWWSGCGDGDNPAPPGLSPTASVSLVSPASEATVPAGRTTATFTTQDFSVGPPGEPHLHVYVDQDPTPYRFYGGTGINQENGVLYDGQRTSFVRWATSTSFTVYGLGAGAHRIRLVPSDAAHREATQPAAQAVRTFTVDALPSGGVQLVPVLYNLAFPLSPAQAPDGRIFYNERHSGTVRIINPGWQLDPTPFCHVEVQIAGEQGLLGLTLDPNFSTTHYVYLFYTAAAPLRNRVVRYRDANGRCTDETVLLDHVPASTLHEGGILHFGPDRKLYIVTGDAEVTALSQDLTSLAGKVLRLNADGSAPPDNPFATHPNPNAQKIWSLGHRNSFGFTFHTETGHLWYTENGPSDNDEINRIVAGGNFGWPVVRGQVNQSPYRDPLLAYTPTIGPTAIINIPQDSPVYPPAYHGNLLFLTWKDQRVRRIMLTGPTYDALGGTATAYDGGVGGLLSLMRAVDGYIYLTNDSMLFRVLAQ